MTMVISYRWFIIVALLMMTGRPIANSDQGDDDNGHESTTVPEEQKEEDSESEITQDERLSDSNKIPEKPFAGKEKNYTHQQKTEPSGGKGKNDTHEKKTETSGGKGENDTHETNAEPSRGKSKNDTYETKTEPSGGKKNNDQDEPKTEPTGGKENNDQDEPKTEPSGGKENNDQDEPKTEPSGGKKNNDKFYPQREPSKGKNKDYGSSNMLNGAGVDKSAGQRFSEQSSIPAGNTDKEGSEEFDDEEGNQPVGDEPDETEVSVESQKFVFVAEKTSIAMKPHPSKEQQNIPVKSSSAAESMFFQSQTVSVFYVVVLMASLVFLCLVVRNRRKFNLRLSYLHQCLGKRRHNGQTYQRLSANVNEGAISDKSNLSRNYIY